MSKTRLWLWLILVSLALLSCSQGQTRDQPPEIRFGEDVCAECNMIISEPRFAAAYTTSEGQARRFDDIGGMCTHYLEMQEEVAHFWVHDYHTEEWLNAEEAFFVMGEGIYTPMAFGVVAFADQPAAEVFAAEMNGMVLSFERLLEHYATGAAGHEHDASEHSGEHAEEQAGS